LLNRMLFQNLMLHF